MKNVLTDPNVHGILVQLPIPPHIDENTVIKAIDQSKDVDGLHPLNVAQLANTKTHAPGRSAWSFDSIGFHVSCTPQACFKQKFKLKGDVVVFILFVEGVH